MVDAGWENSAGLIRFPYSPKASDYAQVRNTSQAGTGVANDDCCHHQGYIGPLAAGSFNGTTDTVKMQQFAREGSGLVDARPQMVIRAMAPDFSTVRFTALAFDTGGLANEFAISTIDTSVTNAKFPKGGSKVLASGSWQDGDYLVVECGHRNHGTNTSGVRVVTGEVSATTDLPEDETQTGNLTGGSTWRGWIEFSKDLVLFANPTGAVTPAGAVSVVIQTPVPAGSITPAGVVTATVIPIPDPPMIEARIGWRPDQFNRVTNPGLETDTSGWAVTAGINGAATSITRITTDFHGGSACASLVCPATALTGCNFDFGSQAFLASTYGRHFYRFVVWLKAVSGTPYARLIVGSEGTSSDRASKDIVLNGDWQPFFVDWAPSATRTDVQLAIVNIPAVAMTVRIDDVAVYLRDALSQVENGNFTDDTGGWVVTAGINGAGTSLTRTASDSPISGKACGELVTTSTSGSGCNYDLGTVKFTTGRTYRLAVWLKSISGTTTARLRLGSLGTGADRGDSSPTITTSWARYTVDWTPSGDRTDVELAISNGTAAIMTARIAAIEVYEALDDVSSDAAAFSSSTDSSTPVLTFGRGASFDNGAAAVGFASFAVINDDGKYTPENASGVLYGLLEAGRPILIRARYNYGLYALFAGRVRYFTPQPLDYATEIRSTDALHDLRRAAYAEAPTAASYESHRQTALTEVDILNFGIGSDSGGGAESTVAWTGARDTNVLAYLEQLTAASGGVMFVRPDADALVAWRLITIDRTRHADSSSTSEAWDDDLADLTGYDVNEESVINRQRVEVTAYRVDNDLFTISTLTNAPIVENYAVGSHSIVDDRDGAFRILPGHEFSATLPADETPLTVPANTRRVLRFSFSAPMYNVRKATTYSSGSCTETLTVEGNDVILTLDAGSTDAVLTLIALGADPLLQQSINDADEYDRQSQYLRGEREGNKVSSPYISHLAHARALARYKVWRYGTQRARPAAHVHRNYARQLAREIGDRIGLTFARLSLSTKPFVILSFTTQVSENSRMWKTVYNLESLPTAPAGGWFILGTSALDSDDVLAY